jgi:hypothetical protein
MRRMADGMPKNQCGVRGEGERHESEDALE